MRRLERAGAVVCAPPLPAGLVARAAPEWVVTRPGWLARVLGRIARAASCGPPAPTRADACGAGDGDAADAAAGGPGSPRTPRLLWGAKGASTGVGGDGLGTADGAWEATSDSFDEEEDDDDDAPAAGPAAAAVVAAATAEAHAEAHAAAVVVHRAATAWRVATEEARERRVSEDARVAAAAFAVARLRRDRIFDAWLERSRVGAIERVQLERADDAFHRRTRRRRFDAWRVFLGEARRRREKITLAISNRNRSLAYAGLEAFVTTVVRRRAKKEANAMAVSHFRTSRTTACVSAWRRRADDERVARKNLADAAESHRRWLLREGCAAWLREGLHRREWCAAEAYATNELKWPLSMDQLGARTRVTARCSHRAAAARYDPPRRGKHHKPPRFTTTNHKPSVR